MRDKSSDLIFLEFPDEVDAFLSQRPRTGDLLSSSTVIALNPPTLAYLKRRGYDAQDTLPYLTPASRERAVQRAAELTQWIREHFDFEDNWGVHASYVENLAFWMRWSIHHLLWSLEMLDNAVARHNPIMLWACMPKATDRSGPLIGVREERYFGSMARSFAAARGLQFRFIGLNTGPSLLERGSGALGHLVTALLPNPLVARIHLHQLRRLGSRSPVLFTSRYYRMGVLAGRVRQENGALPVLLSDWGSRRSFGWPIKMTVTPPFAAEARLFMLGPVAHEEKDSRRRLGQRIEGFVRDVAGATDAFSHLGVSFADIMSLKVRDGVGPLIMELHKRAAILQMLLQTLRPSLVLSNGSRIDDTITGELCRAAHIPSMIITHGSHTPPSNDAGRYEWGDQGRRLINAPFQFTALQSRLAEEFREVIPSGSKAVRTGPLIWATGGNRECSKVLRDRMLGDARADRVVVHAGTPKGRRHTRFHVYETPDEYVQAIRDLVSAVEQVPSTCLIVKFRPAPDLSLEDLKTLVPFSEKAMVSVDEPLQDVLGFTDLLVSFSSTVIEEALQNRVPVLLYGGEGRYQHIQAPSITPGDGSHPSAVYHVKERKHLPYALQYMLDTRDRWRLSDDLFAPYIYSPEQVTTMAEFFNSLGEKAVVPSI